LFVDDIPLAKQVNYDDSLIPHWNADKGIPTLPPYETSVSSNERIVAVCNCGEYGCDCLTCKMEIGPDFVIFSSFENRGNTSDVKKFKFSFDNFRDVDSQIAT
jgi:hypothetical protein